MSEKEEIENNTPSTDGNFGVAPNTPDSVIRDIAQEFNVIVLALRLCGTPPYGRTSDAILAS